MRKYTPLLPVVAAYAASALTWSDLQANTTADFSPLFPATVTSSGPVSPLAAALLVPTVALLVSLSMERLSRIAGPVRNVPDWWLNEKTGEAAIERFDPTFRTIIFALMALLLLAHLALLGSVLRWPAGFYQALTAFLGFGLIAVGNVFPRVRPNWIVGIRTRRTLSNPQLWASAHRTLGILFMSAGVIVVVMSLIAPRWAVVSAIAGLLASLIISGLIVSFSSGTSNANKTVML